MAASLGILFGVLEHDDAPYILGVVPEFFWELLLGAYLAVTGGRVAGLTVSDVVPSREMPGHAR